MNCEGIKGRTEVETCARDSVVMGMTRENLLGRREAGLLETYIYRVQSAFLGTDIMPVTT
jgi:hypothetical protein